MNPLLLERNRTENYDLASNLRSPVGLEQIIHAEHVDADGIVHNNLRKKGSLPSMPFGGAHK